MKKIVFAFAIAIAVWACLPGFVSAHAYISQSTPYENAELDSSPTVIKISFTEKIDTGLSQIKLQNMTTGKTVSGKLSSEGETTLLLSVPKLDDGVYRVSWQALSLDTHTTDGSYRFAVGVKLEQRPPDEAISLDGAQGGAAASATPAVTATPKPAQTPKPEPSATASAQAGGDQGGDLTSETGGEAAGRPGAEEQGAPAAAEAAGSAAVKLAEQETPDAGGRGSDNLTGEQTGSSSNVSSDAEELPERQEEAATEEGAENSAGSGNALSEGEGVQTSDAHEHMEHAGHEADGEAASAHGEHASSNYRQLWTIILRVLDVLQGTALAGLIFFRHALWKGEEALAPYGFTAKAEKWAIAAAATVWLASGLVRLSLLAEQLDGVSYTALATGTMIGQMSVLRLLAAFLLLVLAIAPERERKWSEKIKWLVLIGIVATFPLTGHAYASVNGAMAAVASHAAHMGAAAIWVGGLLGLFSLTFRHASLDSLNQTAIRFGRWALPSIALVTASGIWLSVIRLATWNELFATAYGRLIFAKLVLTLLVVATAALHRFVLMPRAAKANEAGEQKAAIRRLSHGIRAEVLIAASLLVLAGTLSSTSPPETAAEQREPFYWHVMGDQAHMSLRAKDAEGADRQIRLDVWLPVDLGEPASATVAFRPEGGAEASQAALQLQPQEEPRFEYPGFTKYTYIGTDPAIGGDAAGLITVDVVDSADNSFHYERRQGAAERP